MLGALVSDTDASSLQHLFSRRQTPAQKWADLIFFIVTITSQIALIWISFGEIENETTVLITFLFYVVLVILVIVAFLDKFLAQRLMFGSRGVLSGSMAFLILVYLLFVVNFTASDDIGIDQAISIAMGTTLAMAWGALVYFLYSNPRLSRVVGASATGSVHRLWSVL